MNLSCMARYNVNQFSEFPYHISGRILNKASYPIKLSEVWRITSEQLFLAKHCFGLRIHSFVLMPNHFHLLASVSNTPLPIIMRQFMCETSKEFNRIAGRINQNWGGRHYKCEIKNYHYFMNCYKYVYQNPIRAQLANRVEDWPYSTLHGLLGYSKLLIPIEEDTLLFSGHTQATLKWLNAPITNENLHSIRMATRKRIFKLRKINHGKANPLEELLI